MSDKVDSNMTSCCHGDGHAEHRDEFSVKREVLTLGLGILIYVLALLLEFTFWVELSLFLLSYFIIAGDVVWKAIKNVFKGQFFDENFLMTVATLGAFAIKEFPEGVAVMLFFKVGETFQNMAVNRSRKSIKALLEIRPDYANLKVSGEIKRVNPDEVKIGDSIIVKPGERVPLDGIVLEGSSMVDTSSLTGESVPRKVEQNDDIFSGTINKTGLLSIQVTKIFSESTVSKILELVENTSSKKAPTEKFITKFAKYYTPAVVFGALLLAVVPVALYNITAFTPMFAHEETFSEWIYKALVFLVISCPCALVISIPMGFFGGIGASSKRGILVKGSNYLEALNNIHTVVWDKTGTLTKGIFSVTGVVPANTFSKRDVLRLAAEAESYSDHPIAQSIRNAFNEKIDTGIIEEHEEILGFGVRIKIRGHNVLVGNDGLLHRQRIEHDTCDVDGTVAHVMIDDRYAGHIIISDEIKKDAKEAIQKLKSIGVKNQIMLTGDNQHVGKIVSQQLGLDGYFAELLPQHKVEKIEELMRESKKKNELIAFVGDGINDAPVLMRSDIGVAMGALGSDAAIEAADIVLMTDEPSRLYEAVQIAKRTRRIIWQNIGLALSVKGVFLTLGVLGMVTMWGAVFADVGVALLAILNATRVLK